MLNNAFLMRVVISFLSFVAYGGSNLASAAETTIELKTTISQPSCTIKFSPASPLTLGALDSSDLTVSSNSAKVSTTKEVTLTLNDCLIGATGTTPTVTLNGNHANATELPSGADEKYAFKDYVPESSSAGYFIVVGKKAGQLYFSSNDIYIGDDTISVFPDVSPGDSGSGKKTTVYMGVTCARPPVCKTAKAGGLKASLTFTFKYK